VRRQQLGVVRLYHATSSEAGALIASAGWMRASQSGMFGGAIYFADSEDSARYKARGGRDVIITAHVHMGCALVLESPSTSMTLPKIRSLGCETILGRSNQRANWEYVVFETRRVTIISATGNFPIIYQPSTPRSGPTTCTYGQNGAKYIRQPWYGCRTCGLVDDLGCCLACIDQCHKGHDTYLKGFMQGYCDCGAGDRCQLTSRIPTGKYICTYARHGAQYIGQPWYHCRTCGLVGDLGCCLACFELCHRGHDAYFEKSSQSCYCDCRPNGRCRCING
jgi:hypothetical protein